MSDAPTPTPEDVEAIEDAVGIGSGAWDCIPAEEIVAAAWRRLLERQGPVLLNGLTEAETNATASVAGLSPAPAQPAQPRITLNVHQLREALGFATGGGEPDEGEAETQITIAWSEVTRGDDGELLPPGYVAWFTEYPDEGCYPLGEST